MITGGGGGGSSTPAFAFGTAAARPAAAAGNKNTGYFATDTGEVTFSDGATWHEITQVGNNITFPAAGQISGVGEVGNNGGDVSLQSGYGSLTVNSGGLALQYAGMGYQTPEGANAKQGVATLVAGTVTVANTSVTATSRIMLTVQSLGTVATPSALCVSARTAGTSFTILASQATDTSVVAYEIFEVV